MLFQFGGDEPLRVRGGLLPDVFGGNLLKLRAGDLKVVAENRIEANLELRDAGSFPLLLLQLGDVLLAVLV